MQTVIVESPYAGDVRLNEIYARAAMKDCLRRNEAPYASHLLYTQPGVLNDTLPLERNWGIAAGFAFRTQTKKTVVYTDRGFSKGMELGIAHALKLGHPVEYRSLFRSTHRMPTKVKAVIFGSRSIKDLALVHQACVESCQQLDVVIVEVVSGTAKGVDKLGEDFAAMYNIPVKPFKPDWDDISVPGAVVRDRHGGGKYNIVAGHQRNDQMADYCDVGIGVWDGASTGTADMVRRLEKYGKRHYVKNCGVPSGTAAQRQ